MTHLRLILLTTTAIAALQGSPFVARAETSQTLKSERPASETLSPFVVAQAADPNAPKPPPKA
ncbi:MAG: hypothetical protein NTZ72_01030, partial [Afipia sp.]|nr:hypothetical protein [Afipia sp.]